jgi:hypothetical protein
VIAKLRGKRAPMSTLEHDPEKPVLGLDPRMKPVFGKDHAPMKQLDHDPIQFHRIMV